MSIHRSVLLNEIIIYFNPQPNQNFIDCTLGGGGHAQAILARIKPQGKLLAIDISTEAIARTKERFKGENNVILVNDNFVNLKKIVEANNFTDVQGILFDLGLSSDLLEEGRGISFQKDEPLDMRFNQKIQGLTAAEVINSWSVKDLENIFKNFGEEKFSNLLARGVVEHRRQQRVITTFQLVEIIKRILGKKFHIKSLARVFQALRIAVNDELSNLEKALPQAADILKPGGRIAVISFHSLEDRIVKNFLKDNLALKIITKKPIVPTRQEISDNHRCRSAKLRVAEKNLVHNSLF